MEIVVAKASSFDELACQFVWENAKYIIEHDQETFGTAKSPLVIPEGAMLEFRGGCFKGGYVSLNDFVQNDVLYPVWKNVKFLYPTSNYIKKGFQNKYLRPEWFGAVGDGDTDDSIAMQQCIDVAKNCGVMVYLSSKRYLMTRTIQLYSGNHIEGCISGNLDRNLQIGAALVFKLAESQKIAIDLYSSNNGVTDPSGCYKFIINRIGIINLKEQISDVGIRLSTENNTAPREGIIDNVFIRNFETGILANSLSYMKFSNICLFKFKTGFKFDKVGKYLEFAWLNEVYMNTNESDAIGIDINSGNNLYFDKIDVNDCNIGVWLHADYPLFSIFFSRINLTRCVTCVDIKADSSHVTRLNFSGITLDYFSHGFVFDRSGSYNIGDSAFSEVFDSTSSTNKLFFNKDSSLGLRSCLFEKIRALGGVSGLSNVRKLEMLNVPSFGEFIMPAGVQSFVYTVVDRSVIDFAPMVIVDCAVRNIAYSVEVKNTQFSELKIIVETETILTESIRFKYLFPQLN